VSDSTGAPSQAEAIRERIAASQARGKRQVSSTDSDGVAITRPTPPDPRGVVEKTAEDHPLVLLAGSLVVGAVAAGLLRSSFGRRVADRLLGIAVVAGEMGAAAGNKTLGAAAEAGRAGQDRLTRISDEVAEEAAEVRRRAVELGSQAGRRALSLASDAAAEAREAGSHALKRLGKLADRS
jgi:hypothetical protein